MNEELKIIIRAVTEQAKQEIKKVKDELKGIEKEKQGIEAVKKEFADLGKKAAVAVASVTALVAGMSKLAQSATEAQKSQGRLVTAFANAGVGAEQAQATFTNLFRFLGEADTATEAANLLAKLTTNEKDLAEWTTILQGVYATFPDSLPVEALAESANETAKVGQITGNLADALNWAGVSEDAFNAQLAATNSEAEREALIRSTLTSLYGNAAALYERNNAALLANNEAQANLNIELARASAYLTPLLTALANMAAILMQVLAPAIQMVANILIVLVQWVATAAKALGSFFGLTSKTAETTTNSVGSLGNKLGGVSSGISSLNKGLKTASKEAEKLKKQTMGFDELNILADNSKSSTGDSSSTPATPAVTPATIGDFNVGKIDLGLDKVKQDFEEVKKRLEGVLVLAGLVALALAAWKILDLITNPAVSLSGAFKSIGGYALIIAGALVTIQAFSDAWANGIDWKNLGLLIGGIAAIVGGLYLTVGSLAAQIGLITGGIALVVLGIKDLVTNGYSMEAVLAVLAGAILIVVGVLWAFNAALLANPLTWIVIAIMALVAAFVILWNECEGFRNFWKGLWNGIKEVFTTVWSAIKTFFTKTVPEIFASIGSFFSNLWAGIKEVFKNVGGWFSEKFTAAWSAIKGAFATVGEFFKSVWEAIKAIFTSVKTWFSDKFKLAWEAIKSVFSSVGKFFKTVWGNIKDAFTSVKTWFSDKFKLGWGAIKGAFTGCKKWFSELWAGIKSVFSKVTTFFKDTFSNAWSAVKKVFSSGGKIFSGIKDGIANTFKSVVNTLISGINKVVAIPFNAINGMLNKIRNTDILGIKPFESLWAQNPLSVPEIPKLAKGGIVNSATLALVGEAGKEAVMPLENNTEWIDILADKLATRNNTPSKIVLTLDGKELGYAAINSINGITKQTGSLQLHLA